MVDAAFPPDGLSRREAARLLLDADPIEVGDWSEVKAEIEQMHAALGGVTRGRRSGDETFP